MIKAISKLSFLFLIAFQSSALLANIQHPCKCSTKNYLDVEKIDFTPKGIYVYGNEGNRFQITQINHDSEGYFVTGSLESFLPCAASVIASCRACGTEYQNSYPQPCNHCGESKGFDIEYIDDGY